MRFLKSNFSILPAACLALLIGAGPSLQGQADAHRGLWVGQVSLTAVNEVSVPLAEDNVPRASDPNVAAPTSDVAHLKLILHVNGAGQVSLLKDVAILKRTEASVQVGSENDISLVTDERLYGTFPPQPAIRIASAVFDFGDSRATDAVDAVVLAAARAATNSIGETMENLATVGGRVAAENAAYAEGLAAGQSVVDNADVAVAFDAFLRSTNFNADVVDFLAGSANPTNDAQTALLSATNLQQQSFYADSRAVEMIHAVLGAIASVSTGSEKTNLAQNVAASFADTLDDYQRFLAGKEFGDMITGAASAAAQAATNSGAVLADIETAVLDDTDVKQAEDVAVTIQADTLTYRDTRSTNAFRRVVHAMIQEAAAFLPAVPNDFNIIRIAAEQAGRDTLATNVARFPVPSDVPTGDYTAFIQSDPEAFNASQQFSTSADVAARAAAQGALSERINNGLYTADSLEDAARVAAVIALRDIYGAAARAVRTELPMLGAFGPGQGDSRLTWDIAQNAAASPLGQFALMGTIDLPANHPTNPFRHRRHPDHTSGFNISRQIRLDFDGATTNALERAGFGVDRITGTYREDILGLHKPLGPERDIGLKVEGKFELNRISLIDTLNAR